MTAFIDDITGLLETARWTPSSHNTQPWKVTVDGATSTVYIGFDSARHLTVGDPSKRELYMSLGCFCESLILAAQEAGYNVQVSYPNEPPEKIVRLTFGQGEPSKDSWSALITHRRSDRRLYEARPLEKTVRHELEGLQEGMAQLVLFDAPDDIQIVAAATSDATFTAMSDSAFRDELAGWIRHNWTKKHDGMPAYVQGIPGPISLIAPTVIRKNKAVAKDQAKKDSNRITHSAAVGLIVCAVETTQAFMEAGRLYQRACLVAERHNAKTAAASAAVVDLETTSRLVDSLQLTATPVALLRFGYKKGTPKASPRLPVARFTTSL